MILILRLLPIAAALLVAACAPTIRPMGPPTTAPALETDELIAADGARLPLRVWKPDGAPTAVIVALHGFNDYSNAFAMPAPYWAKRGIITYAYDQRGFGGAPNRGYWPGRKTLEADLREAVALVRRRHPRLPVYALGVSMGGAVVMTALADGGIPGIDGAILVAPAVWGRAHMNVFERSALWLVSSVAPWLELTIQGVEIRPSDNVPMLRALGQDPKVIHATRADTLKGLVDLMDAAYAAAPKLRGTKLFYLYGSRDEIVPENPSFEAMRALPKSAGTRRALYPTGYHMLLRDLSAKAVWRDIAAWIADPAAKLPSGADARAERLLGG